MPNVDSSRNIASAHANQQRAHSHAIRSQLFRHRVDWHWLDTGEIEAVLTVTLPDAHVFRFRASADPKQLAVALNELHPQIGGFSLGKMWKGIKKVAKKVATSKVFALATKALALIAPALGPLAPIALAAGASMKAASALTAARVLTAKGDHKGAAQLVDYAAKASSAAASSAAPSTTKSAINPAAAAQIAHLSHANGASNKLYRLMLAPA
jgi:hypothetical protein